jgi:type I restriction enzyme S subunit
MNPMNAAVVGNGWSNRALSEDVILVSGQHVMARYVNTRGSGTPYLTGPADFPSGVITQTKFTTRPSKLCEAGDILVTVKGSGSGSMVQADAPYCISRQLMAIRPRNWNPSFLYYSLLENAVRFKESATGLIPGLSRSDILEQRLPVPSHAAQERIAAALSDADDLIASLERLIAKKQAIKQGMMQQLLTGRTRLPGFTEPWSKVSIYELANNQRSLFNDGDWIESEHITTSGNRLIQTGNIGVGRLLDRGTKRYVSDESFSALNCKEVVPGDILICRLAEPAGRACVVTSIGERRMLTSVDVSIYRPDPGIADRRFLVSAFSTPHWFQEVSERCGGSTRTRIARSELSRISIPIPCLEEQARIADALTDADSELDALETRLTKARAIKVGMMQQLLTGRVRLPVEAAL